MGRNRDRCIKRYAATVVIAFALSACSDELARVEQPLSGALTVTRLRTNDWNEYAIDVGGYRWLMSDYYNPRTYGAGELRLRSIARNGDPFFYYGGTGYLLSLTGNAGNAWVSGGHGGTSDVLSLRVEPSPDAGETASADEWHATYALVGFYDGAAAVAMEYEWSLSASGCDDPSAIACLTERVTVRPIAPGIIRAFEYVAVNTGPGDCLDPDDGIKCVNGVCEWTPTGAAVPQSIGCSDSVGSTDYIASGSAIAAVSDNQTVTVSTDVGPLPIKVRKRNDEIKGYLERVDTSGALPMLVPWTVTNRYELTQ